MRFKVVLHPSEEGYAANAPSLPGCWSQGKDIDEALENIAIAIQEYLQADIDTEGESLVREIEVSV